VATPFHAELVTPERVLFSGDVEEVSMRTDAGEIAFLAGHEDYVAAVDISLVRLSAVSGSSGGPGGSGSNAATGSAAPVAGGPGLPAGSGGGAIIAAVHGGFVHVDPSGVAILASVAELAGEIDVARARHALESAGAAPAIPGGPGAPAAAPAEQAPGGGPALPSGGPAQPDGTALLASPGLASPSPAMLALLEPDAPSVRARRAQVRLEAAGVA